MFREKVEKDAENVKEARILLYMDGVSTSNAMHRSSDHNVFTIDMMLENFEYHLLLDPNNTDTIFLCKESFVHEYDIFSALLEPITNDLIILSQEGLQLEINGKLERIDVNVRFITGDNLALAKFANYSFVSTFISLNGLKIIFHACFRLFHQEEYVHIV